MFDPSQEDEIICKCHQVSEKTIRAQIADKNITQVEQVTKSCEAGGGCHSCHILIELFIDQHQEKLQSAQFAGATENQQSDEKLQTAGFLAKLFSRFKPSESPS
jgi:NifU-like protein